MEIYKLDVIGVPTNREMQRLEHPDVIYRTEREKYVAIAEEIEQLNRHTTVTMKNGVQYVGKLTHDDDQVVTVELAENRQTENLSRDKIVDIQAPGRPILVGTVSIEKSERLSSLLDKRGVKHEVLNAKQHKREAEIVAQAGGWAQ